jgi:FKBP-type peptidyl-prolyl cis-trans isomerase 2
MLKTRVLLLVILLLGTICTAGCAGKEGPRMAKSGDTVKVHYTGRLEDGTVFDTSQERDPLEFTIGEGSIIPGFEEAVKGMQVGQSKEVNISAQQAYGEYREDLLLMIDRAQLPKDLKPEVGQRLQMQQLEGEIAIVVVTEVTEKTITVDANHPLAGKNLIFEIEVVDIR